MALNQIVNMDKCHNFPVTGMPACQLSDAQGYIANQPTMPA